MSTPPPRVDGRLNDNVLVFRAFAEKSYRDRNKNVVRYFAYLLRDIDANDGLSVGLSPAGAVRYLESNEGYCQILVGQIHELPFGLEVRADGSDPDHAFICNMPLMTASDDARASARHIGGELARRSTLVTCDPYIPPPQSVPLPTTHRT
jgi:hypothetical protein